MYIVYQMTNIRTGKFYVGISNSRWFKRLNDHIAELQRNCHHCKPLQESWNTSAGITDWSFRVIKTEIQSKADAARIETKIIADAPKMALNSTKATGVDGRQVARVRELRSKGYSLRRIADEVGVSIPTASKIINNYPQFTPTV